jgi:ABC-type branched-subunit amino acid transport system substrate-binding protein
VRATRASAVILVLVLSWLGCGKKVEQSGQATDKRAVELFGVDVEAKRIFIGTLNDESGPAASIGRKFANGKRLLVRVVNAGNSGLLPPGWTVELVEKDHAYNPQKSVQAYKEIKDQVLFIGTSFGTPNTMPLRGLMAADQLVAFPASLSTTMTEHEYTPTTAPTYRTEAMRAMDFAVEDAGDPEAVRAAVVYQQDDYGLDGLKGWRQAARHHGVEVVSEHTVNPGQQDVTAIVTGLKSSGATHVLLAVLPRSTMAIVGTAAQSQYSPLWLGITPSWDDHFFATEPNQFLQRFRWITGFPFLGEDIGGMKEFVAAFDEHGKDFGSPDFYSLSSYLAGLIQMEALRRTIESGDLTRAGFKKALQSIDGFDAGGLAQPVSYAHFPPYRVGLRTRVLRPELEAKTWKTVGPYAAPKSVR